VAGPLSPVWWPWGHCRVFWLHLAAVGAWPVPLDLFGRREGVLVPCALFGRRRVLEDPLGPVWPPWNRGQSPGPCLAAVEVVPVPWAPSGRHGVVASYLGPVWPPWKRGRSPMLCLAVLGAWPVPWATSGRRGGVVNPL